MKKIVLLVGCSFFLKGTAFAAKIITVGPDQTVYGIAYSEGISSQAIIAANDLSPPFALKNGQELKIPAANEHILGAKQSLQEVADYYGVNVDVLAHENGLSSPASAKPGLSLMIPARDTQPFQEALKPQNPSDISASTLAPLPTVKVEAAPPVATSIAASAATAAGSLQPLPLTASQSEKNELPQDLAAELALEKNQGKGASTMGNLAKNHPPVKKVTPPSHAVASASVEKPKVVKAPETKPATPPIQEAKTAPENDSFMWPVQGKVISKFSGDGKNDGINIQVAEGTPVKAASDGTVMYAGSELKSFGNLVLVKHNGGWVTAYAHNSALQVKKGDAVKKGQTIAKAGKTGDVKVSQVHFELRKGKTPVDPMPKLGS